jgi:hypothetical protein
MTGTEGLWVYAAVSAAAAVAGAGVSIYSANEQSQAQAAMAEYNRMAAEQNASWQRLAGERAAQAEQFNAQIAGFNADAQGQQAQMNRQMLGQQSDQLRAQATAQDAQARDQAGRIRAEKDRILGLQRSQFAAGGVTPEGSPLAVLADTANLYEMQVNDTKLLANLETNKKRREAGLNDIIGDFNFNADTFASVMSSKAAKLSLDDAKFAEEAAGAGYRINLRQADIEQRAGMSQSRGTLMAGYGSALSNISQAGYYGSQAAGGYTPSKPKASTGKAQ